MKKKIIITLLIGITMTFTGCSKQEIHSIDMNPEEETKTQTYQENNTEYDIAQNDTEQESYSQETSDNVQSNEIPQETSDNAQSKETSDSIQNNEMSQELSGSASNNETTQDLYTEFIQDMVSVTVDENFLQDNSKIFNLEPGESYTFTTLGEYVNTNYLNPEYSTKTSYDNAQYAYLESSDNHTRILLVKFSGLGIYAPEDDSFVVYVIAENQGKLYLTNSYECWARSYTKACKNGLLVSYGSGGAGDHLEAVSAILMNGKAVDIYATEILSGWWANYINEAIYNEVFAENEDIVFSVMVHSIGDKTLHTYDLSECTGEQLRMCETYINRCRDEVGVNWVTEEDVQKAIQERYGELGIDNKIIAQQEEVEWKNIQ